MRIFTVQILFSEAKDSEFYIYMGYLNNSTSSTKNEIQKDPTNLLFILKRIFELCKFCSAFALSLF